MKDWQRMRFKKNKVWVALDENRQPIVENGKLLIKYQLDQPHEYWVHKHHVTPLDVKQAAAKPEEQTTFKKGPLPNHREREKTRIESQAIHVYTDGASSGNPGPSGIGVLLQYEGHEKEISRYIGIATNNIAELEAIKVGLSLIKNPALPVKIYTDSSYAHGVLSKGWKAKKNKELVAEIRNLMSNFKKITFIKVKGHAGDERNERVDILATTAIGDAAKKRIS